MPSMALVMAHPGFWLADPASGVDPKAVLFLLGTEMDFERTTLKTGFVFNNPNQVGACGCGESVSLKAAEVPA